MTNVDLSFIEYLHNKRIDSAAFQQANPVRFEELRTIFEQMHPESFTAQKKFILNDLRRQFLLKEKPS